MEEEKEDMVEEPVRNIHMNDVPVSTIKQFRQFARAFATDSYAIALQLLLDRSTVLDVYANLDLRLTAVENRIFRDQLEDGEKVKKTFGGKVIERTR